jgi:hypothetical protein
MEESKIDENKKEENKLDQHQQYNNLQRQNKLLKFMLVIFIALIMFAGGFLFSQFYGGQLTGGETEQSPAVVKPSLEPVDESSAPKETKSPQESAAVPEETPQPSPSPKSDEQLIKEAFGEKYHRPATDANVEISEEDGNYIKGTVNFEGEIGGGWFLAYFEEGEWIIVADGNGTVPCAPVERYDFPVDMVPECYRESDGTLVER